MAPELHWRKSSYSGENGECLEIAEVRRRGPVRVRDSKDPSGPQLEFTGPEWLAFIAEIR